VKNSLIPLFNKRDTLYRALDYYSPHLIHFCESLVDNSMVIRELDPLLQLQSRIKDDFPEIGIMRSIPIPPEGTPGKFPTLEIAKEMEYSSDLFLTDTWVREAPVAGYIGITGKKCDGDLARKLVHQSEIPVILAGGLSPENVYQSLVSVRPAGADSCTRTNQRDSEGRPLRFKKDMERVKRFVREVRRAESFLGGRG
jgi:phosphoribosylanthranilate isomerase